MLYKYINMERLITGFIVAIKVYTMSVKKLRKNIYQCHTLHLKTVGMNNMSYDTTPEVKLRLRYANSTNCSYTISIQYRSA